MTHRTGVVSICRLRLVAFTGGVIALLMIVGCSAPASTTMASVSTSTSAAGVTTPATSSVTSLGGQHRLPVYSEAVVFDALEAAARCLAAVREHQKEAYVALFAQEDRQQAATLYARDADAFAKEGEPAFLRAGSRALFKQDGTWFVLPSVQVPEELERWVAEVQPGRILDEVTLQDGSVRYFKVEVKGGTVPEVWLRVP